MPKASYATVTDLFCGAGGSSLGAKAGGAEIAIAVNHWQLAVETHASNFTDTDHDCADISAVHPARYAPTDILIASPECTQHSPAGGTRRRNLGQVNLFDGKHGIDPSVERSRATMWDVPRFAEYHDYRIILIENVVEVMSWVLFHDWLRTMGTLGYDHELVCFNSMFAHPTPQSRDRLYIVFWKRGNRKPDLAITPSAWCHNCGRNVASVQTWKRATRLHGKYGHHGQYLYTCPECRQPVVPYYYCAANVIDWTRKATRIGDRARPLRENTLERIRAGLRRFAGQAMLVETSQTGGAARREYAVTEATPTVPASSQGKALVVPPFLMGHHGDYYTYRGLGDEVPTCEASSITTSLIAPPFLTSVNYFDERPRGMDEPMPTQTTKAPLGLTVPPFLVGMYSPGWTRELSGPTGTVTAQDHHAVCMPPFIAHLRAHTKATGMDDATSTIASQGNHHALVSMPYALVPYYSRNPVHHVSGPTRTVTTIDTEALLGLMPAVEDCTFRMLHTSEIQRAMAFPDDYVVLGTSKDRVRQLGNAVTPPVLELLLRRCLDTLV